MITVILSMMPFYADIKADYRRAILAEQELEALGSWTTQQQTDMNILLTGSIH